jgi:hypothetical protein
MDPDQAAVRAAKVNSSGAASRALSAKNAVVFECVHPLEECVERLAALAQAGEPPESRSYRESWEAEMKPQRPGLTGHATSEGVQLAKGHAVFKGRWEKAGVDGLRLAGHTERSARAAWPAAAFGPMLLVLALAWINTKSLTEGPGLLLLVVLGVLIGVGLPLVVTYLGSARVASELELVRAIGQAVGDPEKYASRWKRWRED